MSPESQSKPDTEDTLGYVLSHESSTFLRTAMSVLFNCLITEGKAAITLKCSGADAAQGKAGAPWAVRSGSRIAILPEVYMLIFLLREKGSPLVT